MERNEENKINFTEGEEIPNRIKQMRTIMDTIIKRIIDYIPYYDNKRFLQQ